jgi:hypothetical protein
MCKLTLERQYIGGGHNGLVECMLVLGDKLLILAPAALRLC